MRVGSGRAGPAMLAERIVQPAHVHVRSERVRKVLRAWACCIEQLLIDTDIPLLILDPNGDFVGLGTASWPSADGRATGPGWRRRTSRCSAPRRRARSTCCGSASRH